MARLILFLVASLVRKSFRMEMVEMLSEANVASPFLKNIMHNITTAKENAFDVGIKILTPY